MPSNRSLRVTKEILDISNDIDCGIRIEHKEEDFTNLVGCFKGPPDTPYDGGEYRIKIKVPSDYPFRPPIMAFETRIWHPNVSSQTGAICLDTLGTAWSPVLTLKSALISLQSLLSTPEPKDPQDAEVAGMLLNRPEDFEHKAREWAVKYARAPRKDVVGSTGDATHAPLKQRPGDQKAQEEKAKLKAYRGYHKSLIDPFCEMGFDVPKVVSAFEHLGIDKNNGIEYTLDQDYIGDVTTRLLNET